MRPVHLDDRTALLALRGVAFLSAAAMLLHSQRLERSFQWAPFLLAAAYLAAALAFWVARRPALRTPAAQGAMLLWDVGAISSLLYFSEGFDSELYLVYFLIIFMSALLAKPWQSFLVGTVAALVYAGLWSGGRVAEDVPATSLLLRFSFFYTAAFLASMLAGRERERDERVRAMELRFALERLANGGWSAPPPDGLDPQVAKTVRTLGSLLDNMSTALKRVVDQNEEMRRAAQAALLQLSHEKERLESARKGEPSAKDAA